MAKALWTLGWLGTTVLTGMVGYAAVTYGGANGGLVGAAWVVLTLFTAPPRDSGCPPGHDRG